MRKYLPAVTKEHRERALRGGLWAAGLVTLGAVFGVLGVALALFAGILMTLGEGDET